MLKWTDNEQGSTEQAGAFDEFDARRVGVVYRRTWRAALSRPTDFRGAASAAFAFVRGDDGLVEGVAHAACGARDGDDAHGRVALHLGRWYAPLFDEDARWVAGRDGLHP